MRCALCFHDSSGVTHADPYCSNCEYTLDNAKQQGAAEERAAIVDLLRDKYAHVPMTTKCYLEDIIALIEARDAAQPKGGGEPCS